MWPLAFALRFALPKARIPFTRFAPVGSWPMPEDRRQSFLFGDFTVDPNARTLHKLGVRLKLHRQPFEVLLLLLSRPGEVITRDELQAKLWPKDTFVDFENSLNAAVKKLRQTLGDSATEPRFIETVPRIGYRFIGLVQALASSPSPYALADVSPEKGALPSATSHRFLARRKWWIGIAAVGFVVLLAFAAARFLYFRPRADAIPAQTRTMLAVLPFENLTGDANQDYLTDGLTEELIAQLEQAAPQQFGVIAPASVMEYKGPRGDLDDIARRLGVEYILEGGLRRDSQQVRITTQLIRVRDRAIVSAHQYDRDFTNLLALQSEIAQEIADEIQLTLGRRNNPAVSIQPAAAPVSSEAYDLYLKGRYFLNARNPQLFSSAIQCFEQAVAKDPSYARAYAALADSYALTGSYYASPAQEVIPKARAAALKALELDNSLAEAHTALALINENYDWDWQAAGREFRRAIQLDPNYPTAHHWYAEYLGWQGRFSEAFAESDRARQLDPLSLIIATDHAAILYDSRQYAAAIAELRTILEINPNFARARALLVGCYTAANQFDKALEEIDKWQRLDSWPGFFALQAYVYNRAGNPQQAQRSLREFKHACVLHCEDPSALPSEILASIAAGQRDQVFAVLQKAFDERSNALTGLKVDPLYDPLRSDPRFQDLLRRVGLAN